MVFRKIASNLRLETGVNGAPLTFEVESGGGGRMTHVVQYMIAIRQRAGNNLQLQAKLHHGPDGKLFTFHSDVIGDPMNPFVNLPPDNLMVGQADINKVIGECLLLILTLQDSNNNPGWAIVDVYEMRKAF